MPQVTECRIGLILTNSGLCNSLVDSGFRTTNTGPERTGRLHELHKSLAMFHWRKSLVWSILTVHLSCTLFGELVHLTQCASLSGDGAAVATRECSCPHHASPAESSEDSDHGEHDSESCRVCQILALAVDLTHTVSSQVGADTLPAICVPTVQSPDLIESRKLPSRGPPAMS